MEVKNLTFAYDKKSRDKNSGLEKKILDDISFTIKTGKITTFLGANGCGKSTLFYLMTKNLIPDQGKICLEGKNICDMKQKEFAKRVAIVHQNNGTAADVTVGKLVSYGRTPHLPLFGATGKEDKDIIDWAMEVTNVAKYKNREVISLSGGQRQRVWIAMALAQKTDILFLDEPTTYLDIRYQIEILEMVRKLNREYGITIIMVLHDMNHAVYYSDELIGLKGGKILVRGCPGEVITSECIEKVYGIRLEVAEWKDRRIVMTVR